MKFSAKQQERVKLCVFNSPIFITPFTLQLMRISLLVFIFSFFGLQLLFGLTLKSQDMKATPVTVGLNNESIQSALKKIEKQTEFRFFYRKGDIKELPILSLPPASRTVEETLSELFHQSDFTFRQLDQSILIERKRADQAPERRISGKVLVEGTKEVAMYVLVELLRPADSTLVGHGYTDSTGVYRIPTTHPSAMLLRVSGLGYHGYSTMVTDTAQQLNMPDIYLKPNINQLKEVTISSTKPLIQRKSDRFVVNVANSSLSVNNNVWDVLKQMPLVEADDNGALSISAKQGAVVYINGRKSNLTGQALFNYLKSLPSTTLSNIEIVTSPGSEFDASGNAGILNIVFKKRESDGYQGSLSFTSRQATYNSQLASGAFNYRRGKLGINVVPYLNRDRKLVVEKQDIYFLGSQTQNIVNLSKLDRKDSRNFYGGTLGIEYNFSPQQTLTANVNYNPGNQNLNWVNHSLYLNKTTNAVDSGFVFTNNSKIKGHSLDLGLNYQFNLDTLGQSIIVSADYFEYINGTHQATYATVNGTNEVIRDEIADLPQNIKNYTFAVDYKLPIGANAKLKLGARSFNTFTENNLHYTVADATGVYRNDELRSNNYQYEEHIHAAYSSIDLTLSKYWGLTAGMRLEQSNTKGREVIKNEAAVDKDYLNLFPTIAVNYTPSRGHAFSYTLTKRIERPDFWQLNNLRVYVNPTKYLEGNPFLQSSYILKNELSYVLKGNYIFLLSYSRLTDNFSQFTLANNNDNITRTVWLNYGTGDIANLTFVSNFSIGKLIKSSTTLSGSYISYQGKASEEVIDNHGLMGNFKMNNIVNIAPRIGLSAYVNFYYLTPRIADNGEGSKYKGRSDLTIGFRKKVNQFELTLSGADLFKSSVNKSEVYSKYATIYNSNYFDVRSVSFNIRYNFGNSKVKQNKTKESAAQEIINRSGR